MLNPEYVEYVDDSPFNKNVKIGFTDSDMDLAFELILNESDAFDLGKMLLDQTSLKAKRKRQKAL